MMNMAKYKIDLFDVCLFTFINQNQCVQSSAKYLSDMYTENNIVKYFDYVWYDLTLRDSNNF